MNQNNTMRNRTTGKYTFSSGFDRICTCGRRLGIHDAEAPHAFGEFDETNPTECNAFKLDRKATAAARKAAA